MGSQMILNEESIVCRTCLKVLDHLSCTGFTYLDDETSYVKDVGSIREMLQFCIPELDLYVSTRPVVCYGCLPILVQVYNFKIKCLSGENIIKDYISRNNLQEYNHVNLNCVLMEDLKMKSQKLLSSQIENKIKLLMQELPDRNELESENVDVLSTGPIQQGPMVIITPLSVNTHKPGNKVSEPGEVDGQATPDPIEDRVTNEKSSLEKPVKSENVELDESMYGDSQDADNSDRSEDFEEDSADSDDTNQDAPTANQQDTKLEESHVNVVAVRKDLFDSSQPAPQLIVKEVPKEPTSLILNKMVAQNGRIVIKIDRKKVQSMSPYKPTSEAQEIHTKDDSNHLNTTINVIEEESVLSSDTSPSMPKIVSVSTVDTEESDTPEPPESEQEYKCNKCNYETKDVIQMYDHNRRFHSFDYTCQHCPFSTSKVELLGSSSETNLQCSAIKGECTGKKVKPSCSFDKLSNEENINLIDESTTESEHDIEFESVTSISSKDATPHRKMAIGLPRKMMIDTDTDTTTVNVDPLSNNRQFRRRLTWCVYCGEKVENFARHIFREHKMQKEVRDVSKYPPGSRERYVWLAEMRKHGHVRLTKEKNDEDETICIYCLKRYSKPNCLLRHMQTCLEKPADDVVPKTICTYCAIPFNTDVFTTHLKVCSRAPPDAYLRLSRCIYCSRLFDNNVIDRHLKICVTIKRQLKKQKKARESFTSRPYNRVDWSAEEREFVLEYFKDHMKTRVTPEKKKCVKFVEEFAHQLNNKDWIRVKTLVYTWYKLNRV